MAVNSGHDANAWSHVERLHAASRDRKGLASHQHRLAPLLQRLATEPWTFAVTAASLALAASAAALAASVPCEAHTRQ